MKRSNIRRILLSEYKRTYPHLVVERRDIQPEPLHWHNYFEIELILEGAGKETINGAEYELAPGLLYLQTPNDFHDIRLDAPTTLINISFSHPLLPPDLAHMILHANKALVFYLGQEERANVEGIFCQLLAEYKGRSNYSESGIEYLLDYILLLIARKSALTAEVGMTVNTLTPALIYLNTHFRESPTLEQAARAAHVNKTYFCELFKKETGLSYTAYLTELKINYAKKNCCWSARFRSSTYALPAVLTRSAIFCASFTRTPVPPLPNTAPAAEARSTNRSTVRPPRLTGVVVPYSPVTLYPRFRVRTLGGTFFLDITPPRQHGAMPRASWQSHAACMVLPRARLHMNRVNSYLFFRLCIDFLCRKDYNKTKGSTEGRCMQTKKLSRGIWLTVILLGLVGQVAWAVENMYFNLFLFNEIGGSVTDIANMVAISAVVATAATLIMGALSDRLRKRKLFICAGYILWGLVTASFMFISRENVAKLVPAASVVTFTVVLVIVMDCVMTFFGSTANDACFNAWVTDVTNPSNRGRTEGVLSAMPLLALLLVSGLAGFVESMGYSIFFSILGLTVAACGVACIFLIKEPERKAENGRTYFKDILYGFRPKVIKSNPALYLALAAMGVYGIACQIFLPYLIIYMQHYLGFAPMTYSAVLAIAILAASAGGIFLGRLVDKLGRTRFLYISIVVFALGLFLLFFTRNPITVGIVGFVMLTGYILITIVLNAVVRDNTPDEHVGQLQGVRMLFYVLIPMLIGPRIADWIISASDQTFVNEFNELTKVPIPHIFLAAAGAAILVFLPVFFLKKAIRRKQAAAVVPLKTAAEISGVFSTETQTGYAFDENDAVPLSEYPRPQLKRQQWLCLNGEWQLTIEKDGQSVYQGPVIVPFSPESSLSGVNRILQPNERLFYEKRFALPTDYTGKRLFLHFGGVDYACELSVNGQTVGRHAGLLPFSFDVTAFLTEGENRLSLTVTDPSDTGGQPLGKQSLKRGGIFYTPQSGIWQTVWLEPVPYDCYIEKLSLRPDVGESVIRIVVRTSTPTKGEISVFDGDRQVARARIEPGNGEVAIQYPFELWSPDSPKLYGLQVTAGSDKIESYFAMRETALSTDAAGKPCFTLNGKPYFYSGVLDQGYFPDGLWTPPSDAAMVRDIESMKRLGFNMLRKHIKVEPLRWYYHCDRLGMAVWQDIVQGGQRVGFLCAAALPFLGIHLSDEKKHKRLGRGDLAEQQAFEAFVVEEAELLSNVPSVAAWTLFNEGWGQFDSQRLTEVLRTADPSRPIDSVSGWHDQGAEKTPIKSLHVYFKKFRMPKNERRPVVLSEFGGYSLPVAGHMHSPEAVFGYRMYRAPEKLNAGIDALYRKEILPAVENGLCACVYTQLTDVEQEINGLLTYDRAVCKVDAEQMQALNRALFEAAEQRNKT